MESSATQLELPRFDEVTFGYASAEAEGATAPELLLRAYLDRVGIIREALMGDRFLFLGYKGSGKSAIGERCRLLAQDKHDLFVTTTFLAEFPYSSLQKIAPGTNEPESRFPTAWRWLLLLNLIDSFSQDQGAPSTDANELGAAIRALKELQILPVPDLKRLAMTSAKTAFRAQIPKLLEFTHERSYAGQDLQFLTVVDMLQKAACSFRTGSRHVLILDGLDDVLSKRDVQYESLAGLITEVSRLNRELAKAGVPAKIVVLCRTDLFERLPAANKNKLRQDAAVTLDWYHDPREPEESGLLELINLRAEVASGLDYDVIDAHLPPRVHKRPMRQAVLELTRHTPRDVVQLFRSLQKFHHGDDPMSVDHVMSAFRDYSLTYFLPELKDELVGYVPSEDVDDVFAVFASLRKREFTRNELYHHWNHLAPDVDIDAALAALFECSGVGILHVKEQHRTSAKTYVSFKFRNRNSTIGMGQRFLLHSGVWKALNLV